MRNSNWANRTMWTGDNLDVMRGMNSDSVDLIYLDPPFNSNQNYAAPIGSEAAGAAFKDTWTLDDVDLAWHGELAERNTAANSVIDAARQADGKGMRSHLIFMAVRLMEMQRILKSSGSSWLHCDDTASHWLRVLMDALFEKTAFRNAVIWKRIGNHYNAGRFGRTVDHLLFYRSDFHKGGGLGIHCLRTTCTRNTVKTTNGDGIEGTTLLAPALAQVNLVMHGPTGIQPKLAVVGVCRAPEVMPSG